MNAYQILVLLIIGLSAGILSGLVGVGGGIILVPALVYFMNYTQHQAQGSSLGVLTLPVVILAFLKYYSDCKKMGTPIDIKVILILACGFILGGFLGSSIALKLNQEALKKIFALVLFYTAFKMLGWDKAFMNLFR
jgi:uncharacterized membrane protein YfcA